jgi:D-aminopeptidase
MKRRTFLKVAPLPLLATAFPVRAGTATRKRARELGVRIGRLQPGRWNAITDVPGVEVGHATIIHGNGPLKVGEGPVRTGVTAIWPHRGIVREFLPCGVDAPNGNGELTGILQSQQLGVLNSPICLTNTSSVGMVYDALQSLQPKDDLPPGVPVVGETWDAFLNDIEGRHVHAEHVRLALDSARSGAVEEGSVGGGTGMICYDFKGGIGTASRQLPAEEGNWMVGALVQANHGLRHLLRIDGVPVGAVIADLMPDPYEKVSYFNSIIMILATDAPLLAHQLHRLARRAVHGLARTGSISGNYSGDFTLAFSTSNRIPRERFWRGDGYTLKSVEQFNLGPLFEATAEAVEEAIINALFAGEDMEGRDGHTVRALPVQRTLSIMRRHRRLFPVEKSRAGI